MALFALLLIISGVQSVTCEGGNGSSHAEAVDCGDRFQCSTSDQCIRYFYRCNGIIDCDDGSDELHCRCSILHQFQCGTGQCINRTLLCTGRAECLDSSDERDCPIECSSQFRCHSGQCVPYSYRCNGVNDCIDGSDEFDCICDSLSHQFQCANKACIERDHLCDGYPQCADSSDERDCPCEPNQFQCRSGGCILSSLRCNGVSNCVDGSDEANCSTCEPNQFRCRSGGCILSSLRCNGVSDCVDGSDEANCTCSSSEYQCQMGLCLSLDTWCDGYLDCPDGSDELSGCNNLCPGHHARLCRPLGRCIIPSKVCNRVQDCPDDSDEVNCPCASYEYQCTGGRCINSLWVCDGVEDCPLGDDESSSCNVCNMNQFRCTRGTPKCVGAAQQCDGLSQCSDSSDESDCFQLTATANRLSVTYHGQSNFSVCADNWTSSLSDAVCQQLRQTVSLQTSRVTVNGDNTRWLTVTQQLSADRKPLSSLVPGVCPSSSAISIVCATNNALCGRRSTNITNFGPYIINGQWAVRGAWPWQVMLQIDESFLCGGSLINDRWILTAAHCVDIDDIGRLPPSRYEVRLGTTLANGTDSDTVIVTADFTIPHPNYDSDLTVYDVGLIRLSKPVTFTDTIRPICLPTSSRVNLDIFKVCVSTGFGRISGRRGPLASQLLQARMDILPMSQCMESFRPNYGYSFDAVYNNTVICSGPSPRFVTNTCNGDSGGPLACQDQNGVWTVIGVTSFGFRDCSESFSSRVPSFVDWIQQTITSNS